VQSASVILIMNVYLQYFFLFDQSVTKCKIVNVLFKILSGCCEICIDYFL